MDQLDLWSHAPTAPDASTAQLARTSTLSLERPRSSKARVVLDPELVPEPRHDPRLVRLQTRAVEFVKQARAGATRKAYSN
ncbi:MAG TPA: hypothetical protein VFN67_11655, partial [Polyangiales bacterium]|nr:hypothetical protein [Polyangiales bacterium]